MRFRRLRGSLLAFAIATVGLVLAAPAQAEFGIAGFDGFVEGRDGSADNRAGSHPHAITTTISFNTHPDPNFFGLPVTDGNVKDMRVGLPVGFVGNPTATPSLCTEAEVTVSFPQETPCPADSQVGLATVEFATSTVRAPIYNMVPPEGVPAQFGMNLAGVVVHLNARLRSDGDYGLTMDVRNISQFLSINSTTITFWGIPADPSHDEERSVCLSSGGSCPVPSSPVPFLTNPVACSGPMTTTLEADSWQEPGIFRTASFVSRDSGFNPIGIDDCETVPFAPVVDAEVTSNSAATPTGLQLDIRVPQSNNPDGRSSSSLRDVRVVLPEGMTISPPVAGGLSSCTDRQFGRGGTAPVACPAASRIGSVHAESPLQKEPLEGAVYVGSQESSDPESGEMYRLFMQIANPARGLDIRLAGKIRANRRTGQLETVLADNPQLPVSLISLRLKGGDRAALVTPPECGSYAIRSELTPWSSSNPVALESAFKIQRGCGESARFNPRLEAGTSNPLAGKHSPLSVRVVREQGQQNVEALELTLPKGLLAKLAGVPVCRQVTACPEASRVGSVSVGAGEGAAPLFVPQPDAPAAAVYLGDSYRGAPYSLVVEVPAKAGPFDLGLVVVRNALRVDPVTSQVTATSDPLPQILQGVPIAYRDIRVEIDRPQFVLNPTSCDRTSIEGMVVSATGAAARVSDRFQVANCERLPFKPKLSLRLKGSTRRSGNPQLTAVLTQRPGGANIARTSVAMPRSEFLAQDHIRTVCTRVQFAADACPKGSIYGKARAFTPLLDQPLEGPVYLRSSDNELPDLVADLRGQIEIELVGRIDSFRQGIRTTFGTVPDAPVTKFVLKMQGGRKGLLENSENLCASKRRATVKMDGQNGKPRDLRPVVRALGCKR